MNENQKMSMKKFTGFIIFVCILFIIHNCYAAGESALVILEEPIGARPAAMGEAFTAVADDINALYYNPAGLTFLTRPELSTMYLKGLVDSYYGFAGFVYPFKKSALGLSLTTFDGGEMEVNTLNPDGSFKESKTVKVESDYIPMLSYSFALDPLLTFGLNLKMVQSTLAEEYTAKTYVGDVGMLIRTIGDGFSIGVCAKNLSRGIKYKNVEDPLPQKVILGVAIRPFDSLVISAEGNKLVNIDKEKIRYNFGLELSIMKLLALRAGYKLGYDQPTFNLGFGFGVRGFLLDYSFAGMKDLNSMHRMSFTTTFGALTNFRKGEGYHKKEMYERAVYWLSKVPRNDENHARAGKLVVEAKKQISASEHYERGESYFFNGKYSEAIEEWNKTLTFVSKYLDTEEKIEVAKKELEKRILAIQKNDARKAINMAKNSISNAEFIGIELREEKEVFLEANNLYDKGDYLPAKQKAEQVGERVKTKVDIKKRELEARKKEPEPVEKPRIAGKKINVAVSELEAHNISAMESATVADFIRTELVNYGVFTVLERGNMQKILAEQRFQQTGCTTNECAIQMGKILNVQEIFIGSLSKFMNTFFINIRLVNVETATVSVAETVQYESEKEVLNAVKELVEKIASKISSP